MCLFMFQLIVYDVPRVRNKDIYIYRPIYIICTICVCICILCIDRTLSVFFAYWTCMYDCVNE